MSSEREVLTYDLFGTATRELAQEVADSGFRPDIILAIARGGLALGMGLGYALAVKNISVVNVEFYTGVDQRLDVPIMLPPTPAAVDLSGLKVLVADDVADTGRTLELVRRLYPKAHFATVYAKPQGRSMVDSYITEVSQDTWIFFPWDMALQYVRPYRGE